ncbi:hypothetical protein [Streptomyces abikoensis]|uniref:hypothetical protein n=1 Tax=Streptomyces abikoensis TaxID=97398 RepID=UPI0033FF09E9
MVIFTRAAPRAAGGTVLVVTVRFTVRPGRTEGTVSVVVVSAVPESVRKAKPTVKVSAWAS